MRRTLRWGVPLLAIVLVAGLWAFQPWRLFTSSTVDEAAPMSAPVTPEPSPTEQAPTEEPEPEPEPTEPPRDRTLAEGAFEDAEHGTTGTATLLALADGRRFLRLEGLATSDGPDLHVWLSDAPSGGGWGSYDDGRYVRLGDLKATHGNQNYELPAGADLTGMRSVVIWCDRFDVAFGTAPIEIARS